MGKAPKGSLSAMSVLETYYVKKMYIFIKHVLKNLTYILTSVVKCTIDIRLLGSFVFSTLIFYSSLISAVEIFFRGVRIVNFYLKSIQIVFLGPSIE